MVRRAAQWHCETKTGFYTDGKLYSMSNSGRVPEPSAAPPHRQIPARPDDHAGLEDQELEALERIPVVDWLSRWSGKRTIRKSGCPCCGPSSATTTGSTSAAFIWATIQRHVCRRRSGLKKEMFGYVRAAMPASSIVGQTSSEGVELKMNDTVERIEAAARRRGEARRWRQPERRPRRRHDGLDAGISWCPNSPMRSTDGSKA